MPREWYPGASGMLPPTITDTPEDHRRCVPGASRMVPKTIPDASSKHHRCTQRASRMVPRCIGDTPRDHLEGFQEASPIVPSCIRDAFFACRSSMTTRSETIPPRDRDFGVSSVERWCARRPRGKRAQRRPQRGPRGVQAQSHSQARPNPTPCMLERFVRTPPAVATFRKASSADGHKARVAACETAKQATAL